MISLKSLFRRDESPAGNARVFEERRPATPAEKQLVVENAKALCADPMVLIGALRMPQLAMTGAERTAADELIDIYEHEVRRQAAKLIEDIYAGRIIVPPANESHAAAMIGAGRDFLDGKDG